MLDPRCEADVNYWTH